MWTKTALVAGAAMMMNAGPAAAQYYHAPYQGPGCGPPGVYGCGVPYQGPDRGPPGTYGWRHYRPYAGRAGDVHAYYWRRHRRHRFCGLRAWIDLRVRRLDVVDGVCNRPLHPSRRVLMPFPRRWRNPQKLGDDRAIQPVRVPPGWREVRSPELA